MIWVNSIYNHFFINRMKERRKRILNPELLNQLKSLYELKNKHKMKMAAKSKKRLSKIDNKLLKLEKLQLKDVICPICQSVFVEPVTLPCGHGFCLSCFNGSIENNALCCPLCRLRIGSWLRTATKKKNLVNLELWEFLKTKFTKELEIKSNGEDFDLPNETPPVRLSAPGEIRSEYEAEIKRLRTERLNGEQKHFHETELLIKKIQEEEEEANKNYLLKLKQDELLAKQMHREISMKPAPASTTKPQSTKAHSTTKPKVKTAKIYTYLTKSQTPAKIGPSCEKSSKEDTNLRNANEMPACTTSPELVPTYGKLFKRLLDKKIINVTSIWNKENGDNGKEKCDELEISQKDISKMEVTTKAIVQSLPVSLPYTGILQHKVNLPDNRNLDTGSVDSMRQELCYFKPIEVITPTSHGNAVRVPSVRLPMNKPSLRRPSVPSRTQYVESLCRLRNLSLAQNLPSAFVIALNLLRVKNGNPGKLESNARSNLKKNSPKPCGTGLRSHSKKVATKNKKPIEIDGVAKLVKKTNLRRTRSMGSITKEVNETTPKKATIKDRKASSERKPYLRSDSKKSHAKKEIDSLGVISERINNNKVNLALKNLSSPLKNCDVKKLLEEQLQIVKMIEQEKSDMELARKMEAEWNGRRQPRRTAVKRQITINYALRPAKKLKV